MTAVLIDEMCREHLVCREHPERRERFDAVVEGLTAAGLIPRLKPVAARAATGDQLALCHTGDWIRIVRRDVTRGSVYLSTGDTEIGPNSFDIASRAAIPWLAWKATSATVCHRHTPATMVPGRDRKTVNDPSTGGPSHDGPPVLP